MAARRVYQAPAGIDYLINVAFGEFTVPVKFFATCTPVWCFPLRKEARQPGAGTRFSIRRSSRAGLEL